MTLSKPLGYTFTTIVVTTFATLEFSPTYAPLPAASVVNADSRTVFNSSQRIHINNAGTVSYLADSAADTNGIFLGQQEVIATGDEQLDSTFAALKFLHQGLSLDSVAFWANPTDNRSGVSCANLDRQLKPSFRPNYLYKKICHYTTTIAADKDSADVYFPRMPKSSANSTEFPIALILQGALVDKSDYSNFAKQVASYGFVVVVPNNQRTLLGPNGQTNTGLFPEQGQVNDVLAQMKVEDLNAASPIFKIVDTTKLGLLGHSFGGAVGLGATQEEICVPGLCSPGYTRPPELKAGIFYGTSFRDPQNNEFFPLNNDGVALGLIQGDLDSVAVPINAQKTYEQIRNPPKVFFTVKGANHYGIANEDNPDREPKRPTLEQAAATKAISQATGLFLRATLLGDHRAFDAVFNASITFNPNVSIVSQTYPLQQPY